MLIWISVRTGSSTLHMKVLSGCKNHCNVSLLSVSERSMWGCVFVL